MHFLEEDLKKLCPSYPKLLYFRARADADFARVNSGIRIIFYFVHMPVIARGKWRRPSSNNVSNGVAGPDVPDNNPANIQSEKRLNANCRDRRS